jgi:hypothetical protein
MKIMYVLGALMLIGALLMIISSFKAMEMMQVAKASGIARNAPLNIGLHSYVIAGYLGVTFFVVGALGSIIVLFQLFNRRF